MPLNEKIQLLRRRQGWSQEQLAEKLGVSRQALSKWENGTATPDTANVMKLCRLFGVSADDLLDDGRELPPPEKDAVSGSRLPKKTAALIHEKGHLACYYLAVRCLPGLLVLGLIAGGFLGLLASLAPLGEFPFPAFFIPGAAILCMLLLLGRMIFYLCLGHKLRKKGL